MKNALLASFLWILALLLRRIEMSGAVPADEFRPAFFAYTAIIPLQIVALVLFVQNILKPTFKSVANSRLKILAGSGSVLIVAGWLSEYFALVGATCLLVVHVADRRRQVVPMWPHFTIKSIASELGRAWFPILFVTMILGLGELYFFSGRFFDDGIVQDDLYQSYALSLAGFATLSALKVVMILFRVTVIGTLALFLLRRLTPKSPWALDYVIGATLIGSVFYLFWQTMRDEILSLEALFAPTGSVLANLASMTLLGAMALAPQLAEIRRSLTASGRFTGFVRYVASLFLCRSRKLQGFMTVGLGLLMVGFRYLLYPVIEDYRTKLFDTFAQLAILTGAALLLPLVRLLPRRVTLVVATTMTVFGAFSAWTYIPRSEVRLVAFEYSRFCALGASAPWAKLIETQAVVGFTAPSSQDPYPEVANLEQVETPLSLPPIFLIIWDAARPDHMSAYGYERPTTPHLDMLAKDGFVLTNARSSATATTLGIRNMMTGCYSTRFMLSVEHAPFFVCNLAEVGYRDFFVTVTGNDYNGVSAEAFQRSWSADSSAVRFHFRDYSNEDDLKPDVPKNSDLMGFINEATRENKTLKRTFSYLHLTGTHTPWLGKEPVVEFGKTAIDRYDAEVAKVDHLLGELVSLLKRKGIYDDAIIVVTADHGTGLGEHGRLGGFLPYEEQLRIPLIIKAGSGRIGRDDRDLANIDIAPTLLDLVGAKKPKMDGRSFADVIEGRKKAWPPRSLVSFCSFRDGYAVFSPDGRFKLHHYRANGYEALFDLRDDPGEKRNVLAQYQEMASSLRLHLDHFLWRGRDRYGNPYHYRDWDLAKEQERTR